MTDGASVPDVGDGKRHSAFPFAEKWPEDRKRALIERGYALTDEALADLNDLGL